MPRGRPPAGGVAASNPWGVHPSGLNRPKSRMTAYAFFVQCCRDEHKRKHPDEVRSRPLSRFRGPDSFISFLTFIKVVVFADFAQKCADRWKIMSEKEKRRFCEMAEEDKRRYDIEMQQFEEREHNLVSRNAEVRVSLSVIIL